MYRIYADDTLIYDSTLEDFKIGKGQISLEVNKSGSFVFSIYPDHFFYDSFVKLKTIITVYKDAKIVFRGRVLDAVTDYWNNKVLTCEGERGLLQDSCIRPFSFTGTPEELFKKFVGEHNAQVDAFKRFKIGTVTVVDPNNYINRSNSNYESALENLESRLTESELRGYFYITHGADGTDPTPTINYLADFTHVSTQKVEFGSNLTDYTKTVKAEDIATAIIPLGKTTDDVPLTIKSVNNNSDFVYDAEAVALYGWIFKVVTWDDVTIPANLKTKALEYLTEAKKQSVTIELKAIDLHLIDKNIESFAVGDYIQVTSEPHGFNSLMLCTKQTIDLLSPDNDSLVLGSSYSTFTERSAKIFSSIDKISGVPQMVSSMGQRVENLNNTVIVVEGKTSELVSQSPTWSIMAEAVTVAAGGVVEQDLFFATPFTVAPEIVLASPLATTTGVNVSVVISAITETGCHATIINHGTSEVSVKVMYAAYPSKQTEATEDA